jgi:glycosyltransferase involved in cell wall biosynthesis
MDKVLEPLVSVVIPAYQSEKTLARAVDSVIEQTYKNLEIIIVNNGSTDKTEEIATSYLKIDKRIKLVKLEKNKLPAGGRNAGVNHASGDYIAFLDADDEWHKNKLTEQVPIIISYPEIGVVISDSIIIDIISGNKTRLVQIMNRYYQQMIPTPLPISNESYLLSGPVREILYGKSVVNLSSILIRKNLFIELGGFNNALFGPEDLDLWVRLAKITKFSIILNPLVNTYRNGENVSSMGILWLKNLLEYHKFCYSSQDYSDLKPLVRLNLEKFYKYLIIFYGKENKRKEIINVWLESSMYGFNLKLLFYSIFALFGKQFLTRSITIKNKFNRLKG